MIDRHVQDNLLMLFIHGGVQVLSRVHSYSLSWQFGFVEFSDPGAAVRWTLWHLCLRRRRRKREAVRSVQRGDLCKPLQWIAVLWLRRLFWRLYFQCRAVSFGEQLDRSECQHERARIAVSKNSFLSFGYPKNLSQHPLILRSCHWRSLVYRFWGENHLGDICEGHVDDSRRRRRRGDAVDWTGLRSESRGMLFKF